MLKSGLLLAVAFAAAVTFSDCLQSAKLRKKSSSKAGTKSLSDRVNPWRSGADRSFYAGKWLIAQVSEVFCFLCSV